MINETGELVRVRDRVRSDSDNELIWSLDREVIQADPPTSAPFMVLPFSIDTLDSIHIGTCSLYNLNAEGIQLGIRIGDRNYWSRGYGTDTVNILCNYAFATLGVERIWLKVLPWNLRAIKCYEKCGFVKTGWLALDGYDFVTMERKMQ